MLQFFRSPDSLRMVFILLFFVGLRLAALFWGDPPVLKTEFSWILVGEYLNAGQPLYVGVWERLEPLAAWVYGALYALFGREPLGYRLVALGLGVLHLFLFQRVFSHPDLFRERTLLPTFLFAILLNAHTEFLLLSPAMLAITFLLLGLQLVFSLNEKTTDNTIFRLGIYLGVSALCFTGSLPLLLWGIFSLATFRGTQPREYLVLLYGFLFPVLLVGIYLYFQGALGAAFNQLVVRFVSLDQLLALVRSGVRELGFITLVIIAVALGIFSILRTPNFFNFQTVRHQSLTIWLLMAVPGTLITLEFSIYHTLLFVPVAAFFFTYFLMVNRKRWRMELFFVIYLSATLFFFVQSMQPLVPLAPYARYTQRKSLSPPPDFSERRVWVLSDDPSYYQNNLPVMPYLDSRLFVLDFQESQNYADLTQIVEEVLSSRPEIIVDPRRQFSILLRELPVLKAHYSPNADSTRWRKKKP
mgnify:CR=1 FL=1